MADDIDAMLSQGQETPAPASQAQNGSQIDAPDGQLSEEEVEFGKLSGSTQDRIRKLVHDKQELLAKTQQYESVLKSVPPPPPMGDQPNSDVQQAVRKLSEVGIATKDDVSNMLTQSLQRLSYEEEMKRLASTYTGKDGEPQFDRIEYEDFVRDNPVYSNYYPEDVFKDKMFRDEFHNLNGSSQTTKTTTLKPTRTSSGQKETFSPEYIEEKLKSLPPEERQQWYQENLSEINAVVGKMNPNA